jgi:ribosomal protein S27E
MLGSAQREGTVQNKNQLQGLRQAIEEMAAAGASLDDIATTLVDSTTGLDAERRAVLWLYARACTEAARAQGEAGGPPRTDTGRVHASGRPSEPDRRGERKRGRMPYVRCPNCGLTTYATRDRARASECPGCGEPLWPRKRARAEKPGRPAGRPVEGGAIAGILALAREQLGMDVAVLTEIAAGHETVRAAAGEWPPIGSLEDGSVPFEDTFCNQLFEGRIGNFVGDASADERVRDLGMARDYGVRAWIGVPVDVANARLYMLCCLAREARPALGEAEVRFLSGLAESARAELEGAVSG